MSMFSLVFVVFFVKQKTAYEMRISDWSSDVCSSDLRAVGAAVEAALDHQPLDLAAGVPGAVVGHGLGVGVGDARGQRDRLRAGVQAHEARERAAADAVADFLAQRAFCAQLRQARGHDVGHRSEERRVGKEWVGTGSTRWLP